MKNYMIIRCLSAVLLLAPLAACSSKSVTPLPTTTPSIRSTPTPTASPAVTPSAASCAVTEQAWVKPPEDPAVMNAPEFGYYYVNEDSSIWASAWWAGEEDYPLRVSEEGIKVGWFRPAGAALEVTGRRLDGQSPPLQTDFPCCYPTRFQASGLYFPTEGCWQITAKAAGSELSFVVWVEP